MQCHILFSVATSFLFQSLFTSFIKQEVLYLLFTHLPFSFYYFLILCLNLLPITHTFPHLFPLIYTHTLSWQAKQI